MVEVTLSGTGFEDVVISREVPARSKIDLQGKFADVTTSANVNLNIGRSSSVDTLTLNSGATITGNGSIGTANINAKGVTIAQSPGRTVVATGISASVVELTVQEATVVIHGSSGGSGGGSSDATPPTFAVSYPWRYFFDYTGFADQVNENGIAYYVLPDDPCSPLRSLTKCCWNNSSG